MSEKVEDAAEGTGDEKSAEAVQAPAAAEANTGADAPAARDEPSEAVADAPMASDPDATLEVEPEEVTHKPVPPAASHHPPPPPSLRKATLTDRPIEIATTPKVAKDLMTRKLFTVEPDDPINGLERHMDQFHFRHLPVVEGEKLVGLITLSDLLHASSSFLSEMAKERDVLIHKAKAKRVMRTDVVTVAPDTPLADVARTMWRRRARALPVVDADGRLVGIITEGDFVKLAHHLIAVSASE